MYLTAQLYQGFGQNKVGIYNSINGTTWSLLSTIDTSVTCTCYSMAWTGQRWLMGLSYPSNQNSTILQSIDGSNWLGTTNSSGTTITNAIAGGYTLNAGQKRYTWFAVGSSINTTSKNTAIRYSYDGLSWTTIGPTPVGNKTFSTGNGIAYGNNLWVAVGSSDVSDTMSTIKYGNGFSWSNALTGGFESGNGVAWNGNIWVAVGKLKQVGGTPYNSIQYSYDGCNWTNATTTSGTTLFLIGRGVAWNGKMFVAVGTPQTYLTRQDTILYSYDGIRWTKSASGGFDVESGRPEYGGYGISWYQNRWFATGNSPSGTPIPGYTNLLISSDGSNWSPTTSNLVNTRTYPAISYAQPAVPDINLGNLQIFGQGIPPSSIGVHNIYATNTTIAIDNTLYIDKYRSSVAINSEIPVDIYNSTLKLYVSGIIQTYNVQAIKSGNKWSSASDERIKENIQLADLSTCYSTVKELNLYHYKYTKDYLSRVTVQDKSILGFIAQDMATVFPKSVTPMNVYGYENLLVMNQAQSEMAHYGATRHLMNKVDVISRQIANTQQPQTQDLYPVLSAFQTLESNLISQSTLYGLRTRAYMSTIDSQTEQIQSLQTKFDELVSNISSLLGNT